MQLKAGAAALLIFSFIMDAGAAGNTALEAALAAQPDAVKARYTHRHPLETLTFFGIRPGMRVVEVLPGRGWYSKILLPALGPEGHLTGADYAHSMFPLFGFFDAAFIEGKKTWVETWTADARGWGGTHSATVDAFVLGSLPPDMAASADAVLMVRALHNLARFEARGGYLTRALQDIHAVLKPGGTLGVVQHLAPETASDEWADGSNGYLKKSFVIERLQAAGFEFVAASDINRNPADQPTEDDRVWRLPPSLATSRDNPELRASLSAIGESDRMTLLFRKR